MTSRTPKQIASALWSSAKKRAESKSIPFAITQSDIMVPAFCPVLGLRLKPGPGRVHDASPTLDRIVPRLGYVPGNVLVISMRANRLKSDATVAELRAIAGFYDQMGEH